MQTLKKETLKTGYCFSCGNNYALVSGRDSNNLCDWCHFINDGSNKRTTEEYDEEVQNDYSKEILPIPNKARARSKRLRNLPLGITFLKRTNAYRAYYRGHGIDFSVKKHGTEKAFELAKAARSSMISAKYHDEIEFFLEDLRKRFSKGSIDPSLPDKLSYRRAKDGYDLVITHKRKSRRLRISKYGFKEVFLFAYKVLRQLRKNPKNFMTILKQDVSNSARKIRECDGYLEYNHWIGSKRYVCKFKIDLYGYQKASYACKSLRTQCDGIKNVNLLKKNFKKMRSWLRKQTS